MNKTNSLKKTENWHFEDYNWKKDIATMKLGL